MSVVVQTEDFNVSAEYQSLRAEAPQSGAIVFFVGLVRDLYSDEQTPAKGDVVEHIELSHYAGMTEKLCQNIVIAAKAKFPFDAVRVLHRVGKLYAGDQIVFVAVASQHRSNAFSAAQYIMDYLKTEATLWKKEVGSKGEQWLGIKSQDKRSVERWSTTNSTDNQ